MTAVRKNLLSLSWLASYKPWIICSTGMLFYCYNYFLRVSPGVMEHQLESAFHITAASFGTLAGFYYWAYMPMQLPAGMLFDRFGTRAVLSVACLTAVAGLALFINANTFYTASGGRFLIGLGTAFSYIGVLKLASMWLPQNRFATAAGIATATGMTCAALSQKYLTHIVEVDGFRHALHSTLLVGIILVALIAMIIRSQPENSTYKKNNLEKSPSTLFELFSTIKKLITNPQMWLIGVIGCLLYLPASVFLDLWGISWLKTVYNISGEQAVNISSLTFVGWIISGPLIGIFSDKIGKRKLPLIIFGSIAAVLLCAIFYIPNLSVHTVLIMFFITGFCCGAHPLCFALSKEINSPQIAGTSIAFANMLIMSGGAIFQPVVGRLLDWHSTSIVKSNALGQMIPVYSASDYTFALSIVPIGVIIGIFLAFFIREKHLAS